MNIYYSTRIKYIYIKYNTLKLQNPSKFVEYCDEKYLKILENSVTIKNVRNKRGGDKMKIFVGGKFIEKEKLEEAGIDYPIRLEYYKIINEDELIRENKAKYGIKIIKTEYLKENKNVEDETIKYLSSNEQKVDEILNILKINEVTPICVQDVISDISKCSI